MEFWAARNIELEGLRGHFQPQVVQQNTIRREKSHNQLTTLAKDLEEINEQDNNLEKQGEVPQPVHRRKKHRPKSGEVKQPSDTNKYDGQERGRKEEHEEVAVEGNRVEKVKEREVNKSNEMDMFMGDIKRGRGGRNKEGEKVRDDKNEEKEAERNRYKKEGRNKEHKKDVDDKDVENKAERNRHKVVAKNGEAVRMNEGKNEDGRARKRENLKERKKVEKEEINRNNYDANFGNMNLANMVNQRRAGDNIRHRKNKSGSVLLSEHKDNPNDTSLERKGSEPSKIQGIVDQYDDDLIKFGYPTQKTREKIEEFKRKYTKTKDFFQNIEAVVQEFKGNSLEDLALRPPEYVREIEKKIKEAVMSSGGEFPSSWPTEMSKEESEKINCFMIDVLKRSSNPKKIFEWISRVIFKEEWERPNDCQCYAFCKCNEQGRHIYWAIIYKSNYFRLCHFKDNNKKDEIITHFDRVIVDEEGGRVSIEEDGEIITFFKPIDTLQKELWKNSPDYKKFPFYKLLTSFSTPAPDELYNDAYLEITSPNVLFLQATLSKPFAKEEAVNDLEVMEHFFNIFSYSQQVSLLVRGVVLRDWEKCIQDKKSIFTEKTYTMNLVQMIVQKHKKRYVEKFLSQLFEFIEAIPEEEIENFEGEKPKLLDILDKIVRSFSCISRKIKYLFSIIAAYVGVLTNSINHIYEMVKRSLLEGVIIAEFESRANKYAKLAKISKILSDIFNMRKNVTIQNYAVLQKKIENEIYPHLFEFAITISSIPDDKVVSFPTPTKKDLTYSLEAILKYVTSSPSDFSESCRNIMDNASHSVVGMNYAVFLSKSFRHKFDERRKRTAKNKENVV